MRHERRALRAILPSLIGVASLAGTGVRAGEIPFTPRTVRADADGASSAASTWPTW